MLRAAFSRSVAAALGAALLFGASTPLAKALLSDVSPVLLAGLLYLGSGIGLGLIRTMRDRGWRTPPMAKREWSWLLLAIGFGGVLGPLALMLGLTRTPAATASLRIAGVVHRRSLVHFHTPIHSGRGLAASTKCRPIAPTAPEAITSKPALLTMPITSSGATLP
ncbi:MAG TPA: EamA family transporter [Rhodanobacteraceae bacterium]|nr:EamA family transporter [Rhodanobacteraceae bacterium]